MAGITTYTPLNRVGDVFGLATVYEKQVLNIESGNFNHWPESAFYGYYAAGSPPNTGTSRIDRIDFNTEGISTPGTPLGRTTNEFAGFSSPLYGYFGGGDTPSTPADTRIDRLDFSTETISNPGDNLNPGRQRLAATSNNSYGYFGGGAAPSVINTISRLDFSNETVSNPNNNLPAVRESLAATSSNSYGYFAGGTSANTNLISRLDFSTETVSGANNNLPTETFNLAATSSSSYGYFGGGDSGAPTKSSLISRIDFSNETVSTPSKNLPIARELLAANSSSFYGYFAGGLNTATNLINRLDFSNETVSGANNNLPSARNNMAAISGGASILRNIKTQGYVVGGYQGARNTQDTIFKLNFSNETISVSPNISPYTFAAAAANSSNYYGYIAGGSDPGSIFYSSILRLDYISNAFAVLPAVLPLALEYLAGASSNSYGYFGGGDDGSGEVNTITRLDFSNETLSSPGKNLVGSSPPINESTATKLGATSGSSYGYFAGGENPGTPRNTTAINRLDFSTEIVTRLPSNTPTPMNQGIDAVENDFYGYFNGDNKSNVIRLDFSNETISDPGKILPLQSEFNAGFMNDSMGYFAGGVSGGSVLTSVQRLDFSTETGSLLPTTLPNGRAEATGLSNSN